MNGAITRLFYLQVFILFILLRPPVATASSSSPQQTTSIGVIAPDSLLRNSITATSISDTLELLRAAFPLASVRLNHSAAHVIIELPSLRQEAGHAQLVGTRNMCRRLAYPTHYYSWQSRPDSGRIILTLVAPSYQGVSFGLYGLLQEKLGLRFIHPRQSIIPSYHSWPLAPKFQWKAKPRFQKKGFHLHTLHPIELTEQIHNPVYPESLNDVKQYIDWLVRNQQNTLQFFLLRDVDRSHWLNHAKAITAYARSRGIVAGVEVSLAMLQQNAFQLIKLLRPSSYEQQADASLSWLMQAGWDFVTIDFSMGEYQPDLGRVMPGLRDHVLRVISEQYGCQPMVATHVIRDRKVRAPAQPNEQSGILIHTVMCYSIDESHAPVYGNENQRHMLHTAEESAEKRETWYWPESAYWVAFDNSVPLLLLSYLQARFEDMNIMERLHVDGHLTFSSGWEWGYWLIDWSIARWSWQYEENGRPLITSPMTRLCDLFPGKTSQRLWGQVLLLQKEYMKDKELMPFFSATDPSAELFWPFNASFAPRLPFSCQSLLNAATERDIDEIMDGPIASLHEYSNRMQAIVKRLRSKITHGYPRLYEETARVRKNTRETAAELTDALEVTALRAEHRALTLQALIAARGDGKERGETNKLLTKAANVRAVAREIVERRERGYRYPLELIASRREDFTAYHFGYLYPVHELYFWKREEEQVRRKRFDAFFMNIWNFRRIVGIDSLVR